jgi:hypothetical protein
MDEPFGALDAQTRLALQLQLMEVLTEEQKTVLSDYPFSRRSDLSVQSNPDHFCTPVANPSGR